MRRLTLATAATLATAMLTACGGGSASAYCDRIAETTERFEASGSMPSSQEELEELSDLARELADLAPSEVEDDWAMLSDFQDRIAEITEDADLADPTSLESEQREELARVFEEFDTAQFQAAGERIQEHAESECGVDISEE